MAKNKPLYIQHEPGAYPKDADWQAMTAEERGIYHALIIYIACQNGKLAKDFSSLSSLCHVSENIIQNFWNKYKNKFVSRNGYIEHRRVTAELVKSRKLIKQRSLAGKASANARATAVQRSLPPRSTKVSNVKGSEEKRNYLLNLNKSSSSFFSFFETVFEIKTKPEKGTFGKYAKLYAGLFSIDKSFNSRMCDKLEDMKKDCKGDKLALKKMFITSINNEIDRLVIKGE